MPYKLLIYNPSPFERGGYITIPWQPIADETGFDPDGLRLYQDSGTQIFHQVDQIDPSNPSRDTLSFFLSQSIGSGPEDYSNPSGEITIKGVKSKGKKRKSPPGQVRNIELSNKQMDLRLNLTPESEDGEGFWYAGSARSIRLEKLSVFDIRKEYLDNYSEFETGHDSEKRGLQLESIRLLQSGSDSGLFQEIYLFNQPYRLVSVCKGWVRTCVTLASRPFYYSPLNHEGPPIKCELYRVFSLYEDRDFLFEELFIDIKPDENSSEKKDWDIYFTARYFTYMRMDALKISRYEHVPDWFSVNDLVGWLGYGFATDVHVDNIISPHPAYSNEVLKHNTFSWQLLACKEAKCLHLFSRFPQDCSSFSQAANESFGQLANLATHCFESRAGMSWHDFIYKPIRARMARRGESYVF